MTCRIFEVASSRNGDAPTIVDGVNAFAADADLAVPPPASASSLSAVGVGWGDAALADRAPSPSRGHLFAGFVRDLFACEASPQAPTAEESRVRMPNDPVSLK